MALDSGLPGILSNVGNAASGAALGNVIGRGSRALLGVDDIARKLSELDLQHINRWDFLITRTPQIKQLASPAGDALGIASQVGSAVTSIGGGIADALVTQLYVQSVSVPNISFEYESASSQKYLKGINYPDEITLTFLEDEKGIVRRYLTEWENNIAFPDPKPKPEDNVGRIFRDDQESAKRTGLLQLKSVTAKRGGNELIGAASSFAGGLVGAGASSLVGGGGLGGGIAGATGTVGGIVGRVASGGALLKYPKIQMIGLKIKNVGEYTVSQAESGNLLYTVACSVDDIKIPLID